VVWADFGSGVVCSRALSKEKEKSEHKRGRRRQVASSGRKRGRLGDVAGRENGRASTTDSEAVEELREASASIPSPVEHRERYGRDRVRMTIGAHM